MIYPLACAVIVYSGEILDENKYKMPPAAPPPLPPRHGRQRTAPRVVFLPKNLPLFPF